MGLQDQLQRLSDFHFSGPGSRKSRVRKGLVQSLRLKHRPEPGGSNPRFYIDWSVVLSKFFNHCVPQFP